MEKKKKGVFHWIDPIYGLFYNHQKMNYKAVIEAAQDELNLSLYKNIIDVFCGTGALCSVLNQRGFTVIKKRDLLYEISMIVIIIIFLPTALIHGLISDIFKITIISFKENVSKE